MNMHPGPDPADFVKKMPIQHYPRVTTSFTLPCANFSIKVRTLSFYLIFANHMKKQNLLFALICQLLAANLGAQISFTDKTDLLTNTDHHSGVAIAVIDMNGDGRDDIVRLQYGTDLNIEYQTLSNQPFTSLQLDPLPGSLASQWGMCTGDFDNNGYSDVLVGGDYDGVKIARASADGTSFSYTHLTQPATFVQGVNFADINNDGWLDAFICHDDGIARIYGNNHDGTFTYQPMWLNMATVPVSDNSGNYGSVWSDVDNDGDVDLYIAHCRQGVNDPTDPRRINQLFLNNGDGTYTQDITNASGLRIGAQSWTADFGDIDNDGDFDCFITNHDVSSQLLENDGLGHFTDITQSAGLFNKVQGTPMQGVFRDFDNDGHIDILVGGSLQYLFKNNGNKTFTSVQGIFAFNAMESFAIGDLNSDGFQDIYAGYANIYTDPSIRPDVLWMNNGNTNHFFGLNLQGVYTNKGGIGAKVKLFSALGIQTREARSGESYGISNSPQIHFGLGQEEVIDSVVVYWPSGVRDVVKLPARDQYLKVVEGGCLLPAINLEAPDGTAFCEGGSVDLKAPDGYVTYQWNTGETTQQITVNTSGQYRVTVTSADGCSAISGSLTATKNPVEIPSITVAGDSVFCAGDNIILTATPATAYQWSNGATTQSITVSETGTFMVTTQGLCAQFTSVPQTIVVLQPPLPVAIPDTIAQGNPATLTATGDLITWYDSPDNSVPLATGNTFVTPSLNQNTTYWVTNTKDFTDPSQHVGMVDHQGGVTSDNSYNGGLIFNSLAPFRLVRTKVYTNKAGNRKIDLVNNLGTVIQSKTVNIPIGTSYIDLGFDIPIGDNFVLTTDQNVNQASIGTFGPQLRRSNEGCSYPYEIAQLVSITNSTLDPSRYYYFFDWEVQQPRPTCESARVPVTVELETSSSTHTPSWAQELSIYPNPAAGSFSVSWRQQESGNVQISLINAQGVAIVKTPVSSSSGKVEHVFDSSQWPKGVYWLELSGKNGVARQKVVIQ